MKLRKPKRAVLQSEELDITSLMDILVILLVFLLQNFNSSELSINMVEELILPYSKSQGIVRIGPVLQVNSQLNIYIDGELIGNLKEEEITTGKLSEVLKTFDPKEKNQNTINLLFDKTLPYKTVNQILRIVDEIGFSKYKLIVQAES